VYLAVRAGLALNCQITEFSKFDRKNYYYPDLPKNFQTSQYDLPICQNGWLEIEVDGQTKRIGITRAHMEEDAGKLVHSGETITTSWESYVDYNRTGVPLLEIVSEPDMRSIDEVLAYLEQLVRILEYTEVSDCRLEQGSVRFDVNVSLRPLGSELLGVRTETKNLNSFSSVRRCMEYEIERQTEVLDAGEHVIQETRTWDEIRGVTLSLRSKEEAHDYRYFPEPDLAPLVLDRAWVEEIRAALPELPAARQARLQILGLSEYDAGVLTAAKSLGDFFDQANQHYADAKNLANWLMGDLTRLLNAEQKDVRDALVKPRQLAQMLELIDQGTISGKIAKSVLEEMFVSGKDPAQIVKESGMTQISDEGSLLPLIQEVLQKNPKSVEDYHSGKGQAIGFLVGQVMKATQGKANPALVNQLLKKLLEEG
ncbi:MAG: Asp-tRNA(Asn)/Glu-tRNA(Gln) amidotransferase subunit GatB, partial [Peptococcaceae bacterium]|nr:Asp-tRNA(Asn)/Glu-tRNA(Gln) amidotransferase subunit GatB [Peptococcaceae bacterium]